MKKALLVIDIQNEYFAGGAFPQWQADETAERIASTVLSERAAGSLIVAVRHVSPTPDAALFRCNTPAVDFHPSILPVLTGAPRITKAHADAFLNTDLNKILQQQSITAIDICGMMTQNCVTHTAISPQAENYSVRILANRCTAPSELIHRIALSALRDRVEVA